MKDKNDVLKGYVRKKKVMISPFNHAFPIETCSTVDNLLNTIWISLIIYHNGISSQTVDLIVKIARNGYDLLKNDKPFLFCHNFSELSDEMKASMLSKLTDAEKTIINNSFVVFSYFYEEFPLKFLLSKKINIEPNKLESVKKIFEQISDKRSNLSTYTMACALNCMAEQGKIFFAPHLVPDLNSLMYYPNTDESRKTAASLRATFHALFMEQDTTSINRWVKYVWATGEKYDCESSGNWQQYAQIMNKGDENDWG